MADRTLEKVARVIRKGRRFAVATHVNPDGDGIGAGLGLVRHLRSLGKRAVLVVSGKVPVQYRWLARKGEAVPYTGKREARLIRGADAVFVMDLADWSRLGEVEAAVRACRGVKITMDHHPAHDNGSDIYWRDMSACAVGEMVWRLVRRLGGRLSADAAMALYVSIMTDTGCFRFSNTDVEAHAAAGDLIAAGVEPYEAYTRVYEASSLARMRLLGRMLANLGRGAGGRVAWGAVSHRDFKSSGILDEETEGFIDMIRTLDGVELSILFKETKPGVVRVSFRSRRKVDVNRLAQRFGGGGHARAAGARLEEPLSRAVKRVVAAAEKAVR